MKKTEIIPLSAMHRAMLLRLSGEKPPPEIDEYRGRPCSSLAGKLAYIRKISPEGVEDLEQRMGYGFGDAGPVEGVVYGEVLSRMARGQKEIIAASVLPEEKRPVGPDGMTEQERIAREFAELYREAQENSADLAPPELDG